MRTISLVASLAVALFGAAAPVAAAERSASPVASTAALDAARVKGWVEDIDAFAIGMERKHKNLYHTVSRDKFTSEVSKLKSRVPQLQRHEIIVELMRLAAMVGDGHTNIYPWEDEKIGFRLLPVKFYLFEDGLHVTAAAREHAELVGAKVEHFNGVPAAEAVRRVREVIGSDNEIGAMQAVPLHLSIPEVLHALRLSPTPNGAVLGLRSGKRTWSATLGAIVNDVEYPDDTDISLETPAGWLDAARSRPLWLQDIRQSYRLIELPQQQAIYAQLNEVYNSKGEALSEFGTRIRKLETEKNPRKVILDLRLNRGGNGELRYPFVRQLIKVDDEDTDLYVLIGRGTFSAAQFLTDDLDVYSEATLIGEPTGSKPNVYGDSRAVTLPNSGITAYASIYWWQMSQDHKRKWTAPQVAAPLTFSAYAQGRDPALEAALAHAPGPSASDIFLEAAKRGGAQEVRRAVKAFESKLANHYVNLEMPLVQTGWELFQRKQGEDAVAVLELLTTRAPEDPRAFNLLAHVAHEVGLKDKARAANTRALQLEPTNSEALKVAEKLREEK